MQEQVGSTFVKRAISAALSASLVVGLAPSFAFTSPAYADDLATGVVAEESANVNANPTQNGVYNLNLTAITASTYGSDDERTFALDRQFDPNVKLVKTDAGMTVQLYYKASNIDMQKIVLGGVEAEKTAVEGTGAFLFTAPIEDLNKDTELSFTYDTGMPNIGDNGLMTHSVYLTKMSVSSWEGYASVNVALGSAQTPYQAGKYAVPAVLMNASQDAPSMAAAAFADHAYVTVADEGTVKVRISLDSLTVGPLTAYANNIKVYQSADATGDLVDATVVRSKEVTVGETTATVPTAIEFTVPAAALATDYVYVNLEALGSPMPRPVDARLKLDYAQQWDANPAQDGEYKLNTVAINESSYGTASERVFPLERQFDPNIKLVKTDAGMAVQLYYASAIDMQKIELGGVEAEKTAVEGTDAFLFTAPIEDLNKDTKLSFTYDTGNPQWGVRTSSVYLTEMSASAWEGFAADQQAAEQKAAEDQAAADAAVAAIDAIGDVTIESGDAIDAARSAYDALTDDQKALVPAEKLQVLTDSEAAYAQEIANQQAADLAAASKINKAKVTAADIQKASNLGAKKVTLGAKVSKIAKNAFKGTNIKTIVVKSTKLTKKSVKGSLTGSSVKTVKVPANAKKAYKNYFSEENAGKSVKVK